MCREIIVVRCEMCTGQINALGEERKKSKNEKQSLYGP